MLVKAIVAAELFLALGACKHSSRDRQVDINPRVAVEIGDSPQSLEGSGRVQGPFDAVPNPRISIDLDLPVIGVGDLWATNGISMTVHQWASTWACKGLANEPASSCKKESSYNFDRATKKMVTNSCECGTESKREKALSPAQVYELDQLVKSLKMNGNSKASCVEDGMYQELIIKSQDAVEQSFPVANGTCVDHSQSLEQLSFQKFFSWLSTTVP